MHQLHLVTEPRRKVYLVHVTGEFYVYDGYNQFLSILRHDILEWMGKSFREIKYRITRSIWSSSIEKVRIEIHWVAHWDHKSGPVIDPTQLRSDWTDYRNELNRKRRFSSSYWSRYHRGYLFRYDPVPCVQRHHWHKESYFRDIKTTQEKRRSFAAKEDGVKCRAKRNFHNLPDAWDDISRNWEKNWKRFRKHQWKN